MGVLSAVWGSSADDVFVVGGKPSQGEIYHFDGAVWQAMHVPDVPLLVWVFGFGSDDVTAVGVGGGVVHFDGASWQRL
ncbi:MAG: glucosyltransferase-I, partial [Planctomycetota bacterium]|nr:glucosyltransferase-I [Planctomycetota bacterium]